MTPRAFQMTRRQAIQATAATVATASLVDAADAAPNGKYIDAHSHIWTRDVGKFPLAKDKSVDDLDPPSFTDDELLAVANPVGVNRVVLIAHSIFYKYDNSYLIDAAARRPETFRVVGMLDDSQSALAATMKKLLKQRVTGFRITPSIRGPERWLDTDGMKAMWKTAAGTRQNMCCLINPEDLGPVDKMCAEYADTPVVIDHFARVGIDGTMRDADIKALCRLAKHKHVRLKISAYYALGKKQPPHTELLPMIKRVYEAFGAKRLMWASDAPYQIVGKNNYQASIELVTKHIDFVSEEERAWLLAKTAEQTFFYV